MPGGESLAGGVREYAGTFDARNGGFGGAPKFPRPAELFFLLREHARTGDVEARHMVLETLRAMAIGGMRDHVGAGSIRYTRWTPCGGCPTSRRCSTTRRSSSSRSWRRRRRGASPSFAEVAHDTLAYVHRDLRHPGGGFFSAEDADSLPPDGDAGGGGGPAAKRDDAGGAPADGGVGGAGGGGRAKREGAFYVWAQSEIEALFGDDGRRRPVPLRDRAGRQRSPGPSRRVHPEEPALRGARGRRLSRG